MRAFLGRKQKCLRAKARMSGRDSHELHAIVGSVGIFGHERGERLLVCLIALAEQCFGDLHAHSSTSKKYETLVRGAERWSRVLIMRQVVELESRMPDLVPRLMCACHEYDAQLYQTQTQMSRASADDLLCAIVRLFAHDDAIRDASFFTATPHTTRALLQRMVCMRTVRNALHDVLSRSAAPTSSVPTTQYPAPAATMVGDLQMETNNTGTLFY